MKRLILVLTFSFSFFSATVFASDITVSDATLLSFKTSFANATDVNWTKTNEFYKVEFSLNQEYLTAYYDHEGQMLGLTRNISSKQLPFALQLSLKKSYEAFWISELFEVVNDQGSTYYVSLENNESRIVLKSNFEPAWTVYKKISK